MASISTMVSSSLTSYMRASMFRASAGATGTPNRLILLTFSTSGHHPNMASTHQITSAPGADVLPADFDEFAKLLEEYEANHSPTEGEIVQAFQGALVNLLKGEQ